MLSPNGVACVAPYSRSSDVRTPSGSVTVCSPATRESKSATSAVATVMKPASGGGGANG